MHIIEEGALNRVSLHHTPLFPALAHQGLGHPLQVPVCFRIFGQWEYPNFRGLHDFHYCGSVCCRLCHLDWAIFSDVRKQWRARQWQGDDPRERSWVRVLRLPEHARCACVYLFPRPTEIGVRSGCETLLGEPVSLSLSVFLFLIGEIHKLRERAVEAT